jgi:hypothetical protein
VQEEELMGGGSRSKSPKRTLRRSKQTPTKKKTLRRSKPTRS